MMGEIISWWESCVIVWELRAFRGVRAEQLGGLRPEEHDCLRICHRREMGEVTAVRDQDLCEGALLSLTSAISLGQKDDP